MLFLGKVILYGILAERAGVKEVEVKTDGKAPIDVIREVAEKYNIREVLLKEGKVRPLFLVMIDGRDHLSLGLMGKPIDGEKEIRIIPIYHGGGRRGYHRGKRKIKPLILGVIVIALFILVIILQFIG